MVRSPHDRLHKKSDYFEIREGLRNGSRKRWILSSDKTLWISRKRFLQPGTPFSEVVCELFALVCDKRGIKACPQPVAYKASGDC